MWLPASLGRSCALSRLSRPRPQNPPAYQWPNASPLRRCRQLRVRQRVRILRPRTGRSAREKNKKRLGRHSLRVRRHRHASATTLRRVSLSPRGILQWPEEQSRSGCGQDDGNADQSQHRRMWRCRSSCPLILARPSPPCQPSCSQPPPPPRRSLVRGGQTRTYRPRLVVSLSTCPPFSLSPPPLTAFS